MNEMSAVLEERWMPENSVIITSLHCCHNTAYFLDNKRNCQGCIRSYWCINKDNKTGENLAILQKYQKELNEQTTTLISDSEPLTTHQFITTPVKPITSANFEIQTNKTETIQTTTITQQTQSVITTTLDIRVIVEHGPKGVTNKQMIPAIQKALDEGNREKLECLKQHYNNVFEGSIRYIGKKYQEELKKYSL